MTEKKNFDFQFEQLKFEREKHIEELDLKREELEFKKSQLKWAQLKSPLFVAIVAGVLSLLGNAKIYYEGAKSEIELEEQKAEANLILETIKTGNPDLAAQNLSLLVDANLITKRKKDIENYLAKRLKGQGASLPSLSSASEINSYGGVVGFDERRSIEDVSKEPFNSLYKITVDGVSHGFTGFSIHPRIIVTAGSALNDTNLGKTIVLPPRNNNQDSANPAIPVVKIIPSKNGKGFKNIGYIILPPGEEQQSSPFGLSEDKLPEELISNIDLHFAGYPSDRDGMTYTHGRAMSVTENQIYHRMDTGYGTTGGPVWVFLGEKRILVGVHLNTGNGDGLGKIALRIDPNEIDSLIEKIESE